MSFPNNRHGNTPPYLLSAYGIAVKHGYTGTEEEWLASLKGDQGEYPRMQFDSETGYLQIRYDDSGEWTDIASLADLMTESEETVVASAKEYADTAEAYAKGTVDGEAVEEDDPGYEDNAKYYAGQASTYASAAGGFATGASNYAQAASGYATTASGHADNAATSATAAAGSATSAAGSAASASTSAGSASTSASAAEAQATQAGTYAYNADQSAQAAASYAAAANTAYGAVVDVANGVDVKVEDIETQVSIAAGYATNAGTSATNAATSATAASGSATAAAGSASAAADSATAAAGSATAAAGSASSVSESAAQITTNKNDIADLKSAINYNKTATPGYILTATNNGTGQTWSPVGTPTDAQTAAAISDWLDDHPEATTTVQDGSITTAKLSTTLEDEIKSLSSFSGATDEAKLYDALITQNYKGNILGGNITINTSITIPNAGLRSVRISDAIITLNADMFTTSAEYTFIPSFVNCRFIGNAHSIFGGTYAVGGHFIGCVFVDCAIINNASSTLQSAYINGCQISNTNVSLVKANKIYDVHIISTTAESQTATLIDTSDSTYETGGTQQLWVSNSIFEGFTNTVFDLSGGNIRIKDCYFEANAGGCLTVTKNASALNLLSLEICGCKISTNTNAITISGFTKDYRVNVSIHDNNYSSSSNAVSMVSGITDDDMYALYNNRKSSTSDVICSDALPKYDPTTITIPTINTEYFTRQSGGYVQIGAIAFISLVLTAKKAISSYLANAITGLPKTTIPHFKVTFIDGSGADTSALADLDIYGGASIRGQITVGNTYILECSYVTNRTYTGQ